MKRRTFVLTTATAGGVIGCVAALNEFEKKSSPKPTEWVVKNSWDIPSLTGKRGKSLLQTLIDVNDDGKQELVANIGAQSHFVCYDQEGNLIWENIEDTTKHKGAYYPKIANDALFYGDRSGNTLYCLNLVDGSLRWKENNYSNLQAIDICNYGVVLGGDDLTVLDFEDGSEVWRVSFDTREQIVACGDIDSDDQDEVVAGNSNGELTVRNDDGTEAFQITSNVNHYDLVTIADIDPTHEGKELLTAVNSRDSKMLHEGDQLSLFDKEGHILQSYTAGPGVNYTVGNFRSGRKGLEIAFGVEGTTDIGLLDGTLSELWTVQLKSNERNPAGQVGAVDINRDGDLEIYINTGEVPNSGFQLFESSGKYIDELLGHGWDIDPRPELSNGSPFAKQYSYSPSADDALCLKPSRLGSNNFSGAEVIQTIQRR